MSISSHNLVLTFGAAFLGVVVFSVFLASYPLLAVYQAISVVLLAVAALVISRLISNKNISIGFIFKIIIFLGVLESALAAVQFYFQKSIGLNIFGEPQISVAMTGVAKVLIEGIPLLRSYGTFPHPNILGGFLFVCLGGIYHLWPKVKSFSDWLVYAISFLFTLIGLILTFSRSAWLAFIFLTIFFFVYLFKKYRNKFIEFTVIILAFGLFFLASLGWAIFPRASFSLGEPAVKQRIDYAKISLDIIKIAPLGVGVGNQVLVAVEEGFYQNVGLKEVWGWQPIHNIYLLILAELGIIGLLIFILFIFSVFRAGGFNLISGIFAGLLIIGLFDHYLWTLLPGQLMFWLVVGLMIGQSPLSSTDRISPSEGGDAGSIPAEGTKIKNSL